jgi:hypothetical protein
LKCAIWLAIINDGADGRRGRSARAVTGLDIKRRHRVIFGKVIDASSVVSYTSALKDQGAREERLRRVKLGEELSTAYLIKSL